MTKPRQRDSGMTLTEMLIVVGLMGLVGLVISATIATVLRVTPTAEYRIDDARSTRGLQTYLSRDVASTPPVTYDIVEGTGYVDSSQTPAGAGVPTSDICTTAGTHVLFMAWKDGGDSYRVQYTLDGDSSSGFEVRRTVCGTDSSSVRLTGSVLDTPCSSTDFSTLIPAVTPERVELCFVSFERANALNAGGGDQKEITMSVASRNGDP